MKILQMLGPKAYELRDIPVPEPGPGQVLMRIRAVTTCPQWDLHLRHDEPMFIGHKFEFPYAPGQPGHEATGTVEALGEGVTCLKPGDRVSAWRDPGHHVPGCYAQFALHPAENLVRVPRGLSEQALAPVELAMCVGTVFRTLRGMGGLDGRRVGVSGLGPAGLVALQMARAEGATEVIGLDLNPERRALALRVGAAACYDPRELPAGVGGPGWFDTAVDCVGARASVEFLMDCTRDMLALFGVQREDYTYAPRHNQLTLCGYKGHSRESAEYAVDLIGRGELDLEVLVTHTLPLEQYSHGIDLLEKQEAVKVCFLPWAEA
jgi:threonine dehydrogenase-like Zn-dependent dehydrogenase